eukprot:15480190-Alexandrium_andersonii.AAC.1
MAARSTRTSRPGAMPGPGRQLVPEGLEVGAKKPEDPDDGVVLASEDPESDVAHEPRGEDAD